MFRAWVDSGERTALNGMLYPTGAAIPPAARKKAAEEPANPPIPANELGSVGDRPVSTGAGANNLEIQVSSGDAAELRKAVRAVGAPKGKFVSGGGQVAYVVKGARNLVTEDAPRPFARKIMERLYTAGVVPTAATL